MAMQTFLGLGTVTGDFHHALTTRSRDKAISADSKPERNTFHPMRGKMQSYKLNMSYIYITTSNAYKSIHHIVCSHIDNLYLSQKYSELNTESSVHRRRRRTEYIFCDLSVSPVDSGVCPDPDPSEHLEGPQRARRAQLAFKSLVHLC